MNDLPELPPGNAAQMVRVKETDPIQEPAAPGGEVRAYEVELYDGQCWRMVNIATQSDVEQFITSLKEISDAE